MKGLNGTKSVYFQGSSAFRSYCTLHNKLTWKFVKAHNITLKATAALMHGDKLLANHGMQNHSQSNRYTLQWFVICPEGGLYVIHLVTKLIKMQRIACLMIFSAFPGFTIKGVAKEWWHPRRKFKGDTWVRISRRMKRYSKLFSAKMTKSSCILGGD